MARIRCAAYPAEDPSAMIGRRKNFYSILGATHVEEAPAPTKVPCMTLIYIRDKYSNKIEAITLVDNEDVANSLTALIERTGADAEIIDVPIWPNMKEAK